MAHRIVLGANPGLGIQTGVKFGSRKLDMVVSNGTKTAIIEVKFSFGFGKEAMRRAVAQMRAAVSSGEGDVAIWALRGARHSQTKKLVAELGEELAQNVTILSGHAALWNWIQTFFK